MSRREVIEPFVRCRLGCTCPAEVFEWIDESPVRMTGLTQIGRRIAIGGRLLVYVLDTDGADRALVQLPDWLAAGRAERDATAMNRLRLVLVTSDPEALGPALKARFDALPGRDERTHLHVLPRSAVSDL